MSLSRTAKQALFTAITIAVPALFFIVLEAGLRLGGYGGDQSLFTSPAGLGNDWLTPRADVARRYFPGDPNPPTPPADVFRRSKPARSLRIFVLGESTTAGFPYPANGTFSRVLADALADVLPRDTIEVINLGIPATNSFTLVDLVPEVLAHHPDAVLIYAGHNEYYGALGVASTSRWARSPRATRLLLDVQRLRTAQLLRASISRLRGSATAQGTPALSRMEELAGDAGIALDSEIYRAGARQFEDNLTIVSKSIRDAGVPVLIGSLASNLRDFPPFASGGASAATARQLFDSARLAEQRGDVRHSSLFERARDADPIRFRAPAQFNDIIRNVARRTAATYVPVAERFTQASGGPPGDSLFFEHVHPRPSGTVILASAFYDALVSAGVLGDRNLVPARLASWAEYESRMSLTAVDSTIGKLLVDALMRRWPFVPRGSSSDYLAAVQPRNLVDSVALAVVTGRMRWTDAKLRVAEGNLAANSVDAAIREYRGLMRDQPWNESPFRFAGRALLDRGRPAEAAPLLERAYALEPTAFTCFALALLAARVDSSLGRAEALLRQSLALSPAQPAALYQLSLVYGRRGNLPAARATAVELARISPSYPGLADWLRVLGIR